MPTAQTVKASANCRRARELHKIELRRYVNLVVPSNGLVNDCHMPNISAADTNATLAAFSMVYAFDIYQRHCWKHCSCTHLPFGLPNPPQLPAFVSVIVGDTDFRQRAFRQRKEGYIKKLEEQVKEFQTMEQNYKTLQNENYQLREYILGLQSRLLENQADFPPAPSHVNLSSSASSQAQHAHAGERPSYGAEEQLRLEMEQHRAPPPAPIVAREDARSDGMSQLQQAAAAADARPHTSPYGLGNNEYQKRPEESSQQPPSSESKPTL